MQMRYLVIFLFLVISAVVNATSYYISPSGNDSNSGTINAPFFTLNKAWSVAKAGDVIYARGGTYKFNSRQNLTGKNGTSSDTIRIWAYPGERPVFTKSSSFTTPSFPVSLIYVKADYVHIRGIEVAYFTQASSAVWYGIAVQGSDHCKFEGINSHHNGHGMGVRDECNHNLILNCDFHHNNDPMTSYGNADGLAVAYQSSSVENTIRGCRMWNNSDDGLDLWDNNGTLLLENSWAWRNGYLGNGSAAGDGCGFKFGKTSTESGSSFKRTVRNTIAAYNRSRGYNQNSANVRFYFYNNIAWKNPKGVEFPTKNLAHVFRNNIVFENSTNWSGNFSNSVRDHNSNDPSPVASSADFMSVDTTGMSGRRKSNGGLPDLNFMRLASGSDLIDAGVNVGMAFSGKAPDIGAYESGSVSAQVPPAPVAVLTYQAANIKNSNPGEIEVLYNASINTGLLPSATSFEVKVNSIVRSLSSIRATDKNVYLTLSSPVKSGEVVTLSYIKPAENPLQCTGGTFAETITAKAVTNSVEAVAENPAPADTTKVETPGEPPVSQAPPTPPTPTTPDNSTGAISISPFPVKDHIAIANFNPGNESALLKIIDFKGKLCYEVKLESAEQMANINLNLAPGFYIASITKGSSVQYVRKLVFVK